MARMVVVYRTPADPAAFDRHYFDIHIPLARKLPGLRRYDISRGPVVCNGSASDVYLVGMLQFDDMATLKAAFASEAGGACRADREKFAPDPASFQMFLFEDQAMM